MEPTMQYMFRSRMSNGISHVFKELYYLLFECIGSKTP